MAVWSQVELSSLPGDFRIDAEYYQPEFLRLRRAVDNGNWPVRTVEELSTSVINFGAYSLCNEIVFQEYEDRDQDAVKFITAQDVQDGFIDYGDARWISSKQHKGLLWKSQINNGQVLVAMAARLGHAAVYDGTEPLNSSQDIAKIELRDPKEVDPHYLAIYLNSAVGRTLLLASQTGSVQQHTNLGRIKSIPVVILPKEHQRLVAATYRNAVDKRRQSTAVLASAEIMMMEALAACGASS
jgi:restriction endonuclease S subunit